MNTMNNVKYKNMGTAAVRGTLGGVCTKVCVI